MQIGKKCWEDVVKWLGPIGDGSETIEELTDEEAHWKLDGEEGLKKEESRGVGGFVIQI